MEKSTTFVIILVVVCITVAVLLIFCVCRKTMESAIVDYKKDKRIREREQERICQLYQAVPTDVYNAQNGHFPNNYKQINYGPSLHVPNSKSLDPSPRCSPRGSQDYQRYTRSYSDTPTVHELRKQSQNLASPMKGLRTIASLPNTTHSSTHSSVSSASDIVAIENPEKRLSIRPHMVAIIPLPRCSEGSDENLYEDEENDSRSERGLSLVACADDTETKCD